MGLYLDITLTDMQFHATEPRKPNSLLRAARKSLRNGKPGRSYVDFKVTPDGRWELVMNTTPADNLWIEKLQKEGKTLRILFPKTFGMSFNQDVTAHIAAINRERMEQLRGKKKRWWQRWQ